jgi:hypothetical protein
MFVVVPRSTVILFLEKNEILFFISRAINNQKLINTFIKVLTLWQTKRGLKLMEKLQASLAFCGNVDPENLKVETSTSE